jgi:Protein of unknown function (DUF3102)
MTKTKPSNHRSLAEIAAEIHKHMRADMFACGRLLNEAREFCEHGEWLDWLADNFDWSEDSAARYMAVDKLVTQIPQLRNLKLARTTYYALAEIALRGDDDPAMLPAIVDALAARATETHLRPAEAEEVIALAHLRHEYGDLPEATLQAMDAASDGPYEGLRDATIAELKAKKPTTDEDAFAIINDLYTAAMFRAENAPATGAFDDSVRTIAADPRYKKRREKVANAILAEQHKSDEAIAEMVGEQPLFVAKVRRLMAIGDAPAATEDVDDDAGGDAGGDADGDADGDEPDAEAPESTEDSARLALRNSAHKPSRRKLSRRAKEHKRDERKAREAHAARADKTVAVILEHVGLDQLAMIHAAMLYNGAVLIENAIRRKLTKEHRDHVQFWPTFDDWYAHRGEPSPIKGAAGNGADAEQSAAAMKAEMAAADAPAENPDRWSER